MIKIIVDMNLPPRWVKVLKNEGWGAVHWSSIGNPGATDADIMKYAKDGGYAVLTHDLDFRIFGSTARGHQDRESDIDIIVVLENVDRTIEEELFDIAYEIELKYDCIIDIIVFGKDALSDRLSYTPVYVRAMEEGVAI